jgi:type IV pilus assembly protein PilO
VRMIKYTIQAFQANFDTALEKIEALPRTQLLLIWILTFALISAGYYFFVFDSAYQTYQQAQQNYQKHLNIHANYKLRAAGITAYEKKMAETRQALQEAMKALPDKREIPVMLTSLSQAGRRAGLVFHLFQPEKELNKEFYTEFPVSIQLEGRYYQIADFFFQLIRLGTIVNVKNVYVESKKEDQALEMTCQAVSYIFNNPQSTNL